LICFTGDALYRQCSGLIAIFLFSYMSTTNKSKIL
jgi:hypothetical protein